MATEDSTSIMDDEASESASEQADEMPKSSFGDVNSLLNMVLKNIRPDMQGAERAVVLAEILLKFYIERGEWDFLETAIDQLQDAIEDTEDSDDEICAKLIYIYSKCLRERYMRGHDPNEVENAISWARDAVKRTERNSFEDKAQLLVDRRNHLALCLFTKAKMVEGCDPKFLDEAIDIAQGVSESLRDQELGRVAYVNTLSQLALFHQERYNCKGTVNSLVESIKMDYDILVDFPGEPPELLLALSNLAFKMQNACLELSRGRLTTLGEPNLPSSEEWENEAVSLMCRAMEIPTPQRVAPLEQALGFMLHLKHLPTDMQTSMLRACRSFLPTLVRSMPDLVLTLDANDQQEIVSTFYGISRYAAASLLMDDNCYDALQVLETGRGIVLSILLRSDTELSDLQRSKPALAEQYQTIRTRLLKATKEKSLPGIKDNILGQLDRIRKTIREDTDFEDFDQAISEAKILQLAQHTDIAIINITDIRNDAILVAKGSIRHLPLPELNEDDISEHSEEIQKLLAKTTAKEQRETFPVLHKRLSSLLKTLWKSTVKPVLDELNHKGRLSEEDEWPRVCWIPTGVLGLYPIHAAGPGLQSKDDAMRRVISSYAPTAKALYRSRRKWQRLCTNSADPTTPSNVAVIVMDETPARAPLPLGMEELRIVKDTFSSVQPALRPRKKEVIQLLKAGVSLCHFTCHGETDYSEPFKSILLLRDWQVDPLTVSNLQTLELGQAVLALLSACFTANAGVENLQDEVIHLASALQVAGFINVVGSLWYVGEQVALEVIRHFYLALATGKAPPSPEQVARAVHFAILKFRETTRSAANGGKGNPVAWAPFVHFGA